MDPVQCSELVRAISIRLERIEELLTAARSHESWQWATNEMSEPTNLRFVDAMERLDNLRAWVRGFVEDAKT